MFVAEFMFMLVLIFMLLVAAGVFVPMSAEFVLIPVDGTEWLIPVPAGGLAFIAGGGWSAAALVD